MSEKGRSTNLIDKDGNNIRVFNTVLYNDEYWIVLDYEDKEDINNLLLHPVGSNKSNEDLLLINISSECKIIA